MEGISSTKDVRLFNQVVLIHPKPPRGLTRRGAWPAYALHENSNVSKKISPNIFKNSSAISQGCGFSSLRFSDVADWMCFEFLETIAITLQCCKHCRWGAYRKQSDTRRWMSSDQYRSLRALRALQCPDTDPTHRHAPSLRSNVYLASLSQASRKMDISAVHCCCPGLAPRPSIGSSPYAVPRRLVPGTHTPRTRSPSCAINERDTGNRHLSEKHTLSGRRSLTNANVQVYGSEKDWIRDSQ